MKLIKYILVVTILMGIIVLQRDFYPKIKIIKVSDTIFINHTDTIIHTKLITYKEEIPSDTIFEKIDTIKIIEYYRIMKQDFYTKRYYSQDYKIDSIGTATVKGRVFMNRLDSLQFSYNLRPATVINNTIISPSYNSIFVGVDYNKGIIPNISFNQKNRYIYKVGYNLNSSSVELGVSVNINKLFKK